MLKPQKKEYFELFGAIKKGFESFARRYSGMEWIQSSVYSDPRCEASSGVIIGIPCPSTCMLCICNIGEPCSSICDYIA